MRTKKAIELSQETMVPVYVGLDYHSETIRVCLMDENGDVIVNRNARNEVGAVVDLVKSHHGIVVEVAIEACCGSADFAWELFEATEWKIRLAHPSAVNRLKEGPDKTDAGDAWHLANLLRVGYLPEVWLADEATRQLRRLVRFRQGLSDERKDIKLRIGALLREERIENTSGGNTWTKLAGGLPTTADGLGRIGIAICDRASNEPCASV